MLTKFNFEYLYLVFVYFYPFLMSRCKDADPHREGKDDDDILFAGAFSYTFPNLTHGRGSGDQSERPQSRGRKANVKFDNCTPNGVLTKTGWSGVFKAQHNTGWAVFHVPRKQFFFFNIFVSNIPPTHLGEVL